jgi:small-conductance mechanosensitive channel
MHPRRLIERVCAPRLRPLPRIPTLPMLALLLALSASGQTPQQGSAAPATQPAQAPPSKPVEAQAVLTYLEQSVEWYRHFSIERRLATQPGDMAFLGDDRQMSQQIVRLSFDFATAEADLQAGQLAAGGAAGTSEQGHAMAQKSAALEKQIKQTQAELKSLRERFEGAKGRARATLEASIAEVQSELDLAEARRDALKGMMDFAGGVGASGKLRAQVEELRHAVPAAAVTAGGAQQGANASSEDNAAGIADQKPRAQGILELSGDLLSRSRKLSALEECIRLTDNLQQGNAALRAPLSSELRELIKRGDALVEEPDSHDPAVLMKQKEELDALTGQYKALVAAAAPLSKQRVLLDLYKKNLANWHDAVRGESNGDWKNLGARLLLLGFALAAMYGLSSLWGRAIVRYVHDVRRQHQFLLIRKVVTWIGAAAVVGASFASELGSLMTFAGLLTAGLALALQNVILSVAGYFFLIGKYGIRVGDRVQISGVSGEVVDIGLVRLHLMELASGDADAPPTGRVVAFSNSVVFQPSGGPFRQIPGTNFLWHEIRLTLAAESNYRAVEERLMGAVESVVQENKEDLERQQKRMEFTLSLHAPRSLEPRSKLRLTQSGLEVVIRYPVPVDKAAETDDRIARALLDAIDRQPKLKLVGTVTPNLQPVAAVPMEAAAARG